LKILYNLIIRYSKVRTAFVIPTNLILPFFTARLRMFASLRAERS